MELKISKRGLVLKSADIEDQHDIDHVTYMPLIEVDLRMCLGAVKDQGSAPEV